MVGPENDGHGRDKQFSGFVVTLVLFVAVFLFFSRILANRRRSCSCFRSHCCTTAGNPILGRPGASGTHSTQRGLVGLFGLSDGSLVFDRLHSLHGAVRLFSERCSATQGHSTTQGGSTAQGCSAAKG